MNIKVVVNDKMQRRYAYYRTQPIGRNFDPSFTPLPKANARSARTERLR